MPVRVADRIAGYRPCLMLESAGVFARAVVAAVAPDSVGRAKSLLWAAAKAVRLCGVGGVGAGAGGGVAPVGDRAVHRDRGRAVRTA